MPVGVSTGQHPILPLVLVIWSWQDPMSVLLLDTEEFVLLVDTKEEGELLDSL